ncbi:MAG TPA: molybdenum cofactor biosynthesis protein MoaE [Gemmatimonadales bacterium]|nr:molybdenum cofactor biosynthesis protein MoaE [Gemmatimonadales bacterium]
MASPTSATVRVRFFARYAELVGRTEAAVSVSLPATVGDVVRRVRDDVPGAGGIPERPLAAVNLKHVKLDARVQDGDEVALLPPIAGGALTYLTRERLALAELLAEVAAPECGGTAAFLGTVRAGPAEGGVTAIEYSAYEAMVEGEFARLVADARARWPEARIAVRHRLGTIPTGEASIAIAAAAPHRAQAFDACRFVIEEVKRRIPVWKKELRSDGSAVWVDPAGRPTAKPSHV